MHYNNNKQIKLIFLGPPGAGKGTQTEIISEKYSIPAISTGAILRSAIKNQTELGKTAAKYVEAGELVPDDIIIGIMKERLAEDDCKNGYILDGFPRTMAQAIALDESGAEISLVINLAVDDDVIIRRMSGRRVCCTCGATYHIEYNPTEDNKTCPRCGGPLACRKDDEPSVVESRLKVYHEQTEPLIKYYEEKGILRTVIGQEKLEDTTALTLNVIENYLKG